MEKKDKLESGDDGYVDPPVPIPNTVVKHINAESTWLETAWEDRKLPVRVKSHFVLRWLFFYFVLLPGLRPSAVSVSCSTSAVSLVSQDAFAWDVLTNRQCLLETSARIGSCRLRWESFRNEMALFYIIGKFSYCETKRKKTAWKCRHQKKKNYSRINGSSSSKHNSSKGSSS